MKKLLAAVFLLSIPALSYSAWLGSEVVNVASFTVGNPTTANINGTQPGDVIRGIILSTQTGVTVSVYDSSRTATNQIAQLLVSNSTGTTVQSRYVDFNVRVSSGITFSISNNTSGITIIYSRGRPN